MTSEYIIWSSDLGKRIDARAGRSLMMQKTPLSFNPFRICLICVRLLSMIYNDEEFAKYQFVATKIIVKKTKHLLNFHFHTA